jgi:hypothetical protein
LTRSILKSQHEAPAVPTDIVPSGAMNGTIELMTSQTAPDWQLQIGESGASSRYNFNLELERLVCKQTALAA